VSAPGERASSAADSVAAAAGSARTLSMIQHSKVNWPRITFGSKTRLFSNAMPNQTPMKTLATQVSSTFLFDKCSSADSLGSAAAPVPVSASAWGRGVSKEAQWRRQQQVSPPHRQSAIRCLRGGPSRKLESELSNRRSAIAVRASRSSFFVVTARCSAGKISNLRQQRVARWR